MLSPGRCKKMVKKMMIKSPRGDHHGGIEGILRHARALGLDDEQKAKLEKLAYNTKMELIDLKANLAKEKLKLQKMIHSDRPSLMEIERQLKQVAKARVNLQYKKISSMLEARKILTKEQREKMMRSMHSMTCGEEEMEMCAESPELSEGLESIEVSVEEEDD